MELVKAPGSSGADTYRRVVQALPPMRDGYLTEPGSTHRNGLPETHPYVWNDDQEVAAPREIVRALHRELGLRYFGCCEHCEHDDGAPPHTIRCDGGCNDSQEGETP